MIVGRLNSSQDGIVFDTTGEVQCLSSGHGNVPKILIDEKRNKGGGVIQINPSTESNGCQPFQQNRIYDIDGIVPAISSQLSNGSHMIQVKSATKDGFETAKEGDSINLSMPNSKTRRGRVGVGVAQTLDTQANQSVIVAQRGRGEGWKQELEERADGNTNTLTGVQKDNMLFLEGSIRRLTEIEVEKLQGFLPNHTKYGLYPKKKISQEVFNNLTNEQKIAIINTSCTKKQMSRTSRYKQCGNAVTVDIVELVANKLFQSLNQNK